MNGTRDWQVILLGGASGVGKMSVSYRLARQLGVGITGIDDFQIVLEHMTTPEQQPILHFLRTQHDALRQMTEDERLEHTIRYAEVTAGPLELVFTTDLGGTFLASRDLLADLELELAAEGASWHDASPLLAVYSATDEDDLTDCPVMGVH